MTTNHIDQLAQWWENAEETSAVNIGDLVIEDRRGLEGGFDIWPARRNALPVDGVPRRVLSRAPKPKPAWHDAVAVIAHTARFSERRPFALTHTEDVLDPYNTEWITRDDLIDPAPLIEAKVTDEMVERLEGHFLNTANMALPEGLARRMLTAALGLETE